jgi:hypothetical protein
MSNQGKSHWQMHGPWSSLCSQLSLIPFLSFLSLWPPFPQQSPGPLRRTFNNDMLLAFISSSCIAALVYILTSCSGRVFWKTHKGQPLLFPMCSCLAKAASQEFQNSHKYTSQSQGGHCAQKSSSKPGQVNGGSEAGWAIPRAHTPEPLS